MSDDTTNDPTGLVDDAAEARATSDDDGAAARGEYDAAQGSPHPAAPEPSGDAAEELVQEAPSQSEDTERRGDA